MPFIRLLILGAIIWLLYRLVRRFLPSNPPVTHQGESTRMVKCSRCGIYITKDDALEKENAFYCCREHYAENNEDQDRSK